MAGELGFRHVAFEELVAVLDIISLHANLNPSSYHILNRQAFANTGPQIVSASQVRENRFLTSSLSEPDCSPEQGSSAPSFYNLVALRLAGTGSLSFPVSETREFIRISSTSNQSLSFQKDIYPIFENPVSLPRRRTTFTLLEGLSQLLAVVSWREFRPVRKRREGRVP
ncbi:MAG: hypothetical protein WBL40_16825 [Terrimicrobiaceae bacterium]